MKTISKHLAHYLPLAGIFVSAVLAFWLFAYDRKFQFAVAIAVSISYVVWGVVHHILHKDICLEIIFEYIMFAAVGLLILASVIFYA
jgi:hypothetical protein